MGDVYTQLCRLHTLKANLEVIREELCESHRVTKGWRRQASTPVISEVDRRFNFSTAPLQVLGEILCGVLGVEDHQVVEPLIVFGSDTAVGQPLPDALSCLLGSPDLRGVKADTPLRGDPSPELRRSLPPLNRTL